MPLVPILLSHWKTLLPLAIAVVLGIMLMFTKLELAALKEAQAIAAQEAEKTARAAEARYNQLAQSAEAKYHDDAKKTADAHAANLAIAARGVRFKTNSRCVPSNPDTAGNPIDGTTEVRLPDTFVLDLVALARDGDAAADYARAGHVWAKSLKDH